MDINKINTLIFIFQLHMDTKMKMNFKFWIKKRDSHFSVHFGLIIQIKKRDNTKMKCESIQIQNHAGGGRYLFFKIRNRRGGGGGGGMN